MSQSLLIEFLTEELPPINLEANIGNCFSQNLFLELKSFTNPTSTITTIVSPRRFGAIISNVATREESKETLRKGPTIINGLKNNNPTNALLGFAKSCGLDWSELIQSNDGYFYAQQKKQGETLENVLGNIITNSLKKLAIGKYMRWANNDYSFIRPVHNLLVMHGDKVLDIKTKIFGLMPNDNTQGHRVMSNGMLTIPNANQ